MSTIYLLENTTYFTLFICLGLSLLIASVILFASFGLAIQTPDPEKTSAYECGFEPFEDARNRFDVRFYIEKGFSVAEIATYSKFFGTIATIVGGVIGGLAAVHLGVMRSLFIGALISALSNLLFAWLALITADVKILAFVITADNIASGFAGATFIVYLSALTSIKFTATQYALFSSAMLFLPKLIAGYAGGFVNLFGYSTFFIFTAIIGVPVLFLIMWINKTVKISKK